MSALGQKQTLAPQKVMSALPPKADMCSALAYVCFGPIADIAETSLQLFCRRVLSARIRAGTVGAIRDRCH
jgi:hypothetical protein